MKFFWNSDQMRLRAFWRLLLQMAIEILISVLLLLSIAWIAQSSRMATQAQVNNLGDIISVVASIIAIILAVRLLDRRRFSDLGFHFSKNWWLDLGFGVVLAAGLWTLIFIAGTAAGWMKVTGTFVVQKPGGNFALTILVAAAMYLVFGFREELGFRGYQLINLAEGFNSKRIGPRWAIILALLISSTVFGLVHLLNDNASFLSTLSATMGGLILALGFVLTGELALPIGFHVAWNFVQGNVFGFTVSGEYSPLATFIATQCDGPALWVGGAFGPESGLLAISAVALGCLLVVLWVRLRYGRVELQTRLAKYPMYPTQNAKAAVTTVLGLTALLVAGVFLMALLGKGN